MYCKIRYSLIYYYLENVTAKFQYTNEYNRRKKMINFMIYIKDLIRKKRNKEELTENEINFFIYSFNRDEILTEQASALITLMYENGITIKEMSYIAKAIAETGEKSEIYKLSNQIVDLHPIGGMDDKVVIITLAVICALNLPAVKVIGREIGIKDKIGNAEVYNYNHKNLSELEEKLNNNEIILFNEHKNLAPVENKLYKLRNDIACNDDVSLIAISLISQKIALGIKNVVIDISYGEKAYVKDQKNAEKLAKYLIKIGNELNMGIKCIITKLDEPVGNFFGNTLELKEALGFLKGNMADDIKELVFLMTNNMIDLIEKNSHSKINRRLVFDVIENKNAYRKLLELINEKEETVVETNIKNVVPIMSNIDGYVEKIDLSLIRTTAKYLNAIRHKEDEKLDKGAGIEFSKKIRRFRKNW